MLNELSVLGDSLRASGVAVPLRHRDIFDVPPRPGVVLGLTVDASVGLVEECPLERMATLWALRDGKHNSFPVVPIKAPFLKVDLTDRLWKELEAADAPQRVALLEDALSRFSVDESRHIRWWNSRQNRLKERLNSLDSTPPSAELAAFLEVTRRFTSGDLRAFLNSASSAVLAAAKDQILSDLDLAQELLIGRLKTSRGQTSATTDLRLVFDVADFPQFPVRVAAPIMAEHLSTALIAADEADGETGGRCAYSGAPAVLNEGPFPQVLLPILGETPIFSMFNEARCQTRYGMTGSSVMPIGRKAVLEFDAALRMLTDARRQGRTWGRIPGEVPKKAYLLIAYLVAPATEALETVALLAGPTDAAAEGTFEAVAARFFDAVDELQVGIDSTIEVVVLRKIDPGRGQVVLRESLLVNELEAATSRWRAASQNVPGVRIPIPVKEGEGTWFASPRAPFPLRVAEIISRQWIRDGTESHEVQGGLSINEVFTLFLRPNPRSAKRLLTLTLQRTGPLLLTAGHLLNRDSEQEWSRSLSVRGRFAALSSASLLGLSLSFLGLEMEDYMTQAAFQVGRLLSLADQLHREYCKGVRSTKMPPRLVGNSLMRTVLSNPRDGLALLAERILPYQAWAATAEGKDSALAKWILGQMGEVSRELGAQDLLTRSDEAIRAQVLLGYLARPERQKDKGDTETIDPESKEDDHA